MDLSAFPILQALPPRGATIARHYRHGRPVRIVWDDSGVLRSIEEAEDESTDLWIAPGLIDLQINGFGGVDFQRDEAISEASLLYAVRALRDHGCHRFFLTLTTRPWPEPLEHIRRYRALIQANPELRRSVAGWHVEGPFLSDKPGYCGTHNPRWMVDSSVQHIQQLREATVTDKVFLTLAPERSNAAAAIAEAVRCGFVVSAGHSNAGEADLKAAVAAGARAFTHLANGCPQQLDRHRNILWNVIDEEALATGIIPDGIHVSPKLFRILHRAIDPERIYWVTDAMSAAGAPPGKYTLGETEFVVGEDRVVRNPLTNSFGGSALTPLEGIRRGATMLRRSWRDVWDFFSMHPAKLVGLPSELAPGSPAGFCLLRAP